MKNKARYILDLFRQIYRLDQPMPEISYGVDNFSKVQISQGDTIPLEKQLPYTPDLKKIIWKTWKGVNIPFFFDRENTDLIQHSGDQVIIKMDIISSAFYLLSGWHEYFSDARDRFGRVPFENSIQCQLNITGIPIVNYYFDILKTALEEVMHLQIPNPNWSGKDFAVCITHDIDTCETGWLEGGFHALKNGNVLGPVKLLTQKLFSHDTWFNFEEILRMEKEYQATSTFFFMTNTKPYSEIKNADYHFRRKKFLKVQQQITEAGCEVGIHGSAGTSTNLKQLQTEMEYFCNPVLGNRFHFLLYQPEQTGTVIEKANLSYDSTMGFSEFPGFRNSFCFPFQPYDISNDRCYRFIEIPLNVMDGTLRKNLHLDPSKVMNTVDPLLSEVKKFGGVLTILWHNTHFSDYKYKGWGAAYRQILTSCYQKAAILSCAGILIKRS